MSVRTNASNEGLKRTTSPTPTAFTIAGWVMKRGTGNNDWSCIAGLASSGGGNWTILYERLAGTSGVHIHGQNGDADLGIVLSLDTWYYFAIGCNGTGAGTLTGWIITTSGTVYTASIPGSSFTPVEMFLLNNTVWGEWMNGLIADPMVWTTKLTTAELQAQRVASDPVSQTGAIYNWAHLKVHTDLSDYSGNSRPWTSMGGTLSTEDDPPGLWVDSGNIDLDLVSYTSTINPITLLETELISLDLVVYSSTINAISVLENELILLDLVTYSSEINDIIILENETTNLDLVSYVIVVQDISVTESELISLELVIYSSTINDIGVIENETVSLELVTYSSTINDLDLIESELLNLDLVVFTSTINDISILEGSQITLDLVTYTSIVNDLVILESEPILLDLVLYTSIINDIELTEDSLIFLDLIVYTSTINAISIIETETISLDLVEFSYLVNDISLLDLVVVYVTPMIRCYTISEESRCITIEAEERIFEISS